MHSEGPDPTVNEHTDIDARLDQVAKIAQNARTTWFGLLALLVFVGVTLMGHTDSDFFAFGAETELPLVGLSVPTVSFFITAPTLTAALYVYLHIYLHGLWIALAKCPPRFGQAPLEERVYPSMLCTAALAIRRRLRREDDEPVEGSRAATVLISGLMVWLLGPLVLGVLWWRSMPYHHEWLTLWLALWLWLALIVGGNSLFHLLYLMRSGKLYPYSLFRRPLAHPKPIISLVLLVGLAMISWDTTEGARFVSLVRADLSGAELTRKPADWLHYDIWLEDWEHQFRIRECPGSVASGAPCPSDKLGEFQRNTKRRWETLTQSLDSPDLRRADLRGASLIGAFLTGSDLIGARLEGADLRGAWLEGTQLMDAQLQRADLTKARLAGADLRGAQFWGSSHGIGSNSEASSGPDLGMTWDAFVLQELQGVGTDLDWFRPPHPWEQYSSEIEGTRLGGADLRAVRLEDTDLRRVRMEGADLRHAQLDRADLRAAALPGADLRGASLEEAILSDLEVSFLAALFDGGVETGGSLGNVSMGGANLRWARLEGAKLREARLEDANLYGVVGLDQTQLDQACGDEHTQLPSGLSIPTCAD